MAASYNKMADIKGPYEKWFSFLRRPEDRMKQENTRVVVPVQTNCKGPQPVTHRYNARKSSLMNPYILFLVLILLLLAFNKDTDRRGHLWAVKK